MSRLAGTILDANSGAATGLQTSIPDLELGGWNGWAPDFTSYLSNQIYVPKPVIPVLLEGPAGFQYLQNPEKWLGQLRTLMELRMKSIQGLNRTLEVETTETPVGGSGEVQEDPLDVKATRSQISYQWDEVYGMAIANFWDLYIRTLIMDPSSKIANIFTLAGTKPTDQLADLYSFSMLYIEPDQTMGGVVNAWMSTNMFPKTSGEITARRDMTQPSEQRTHDVQFTSITQTGAGVKTIAKKILTSMNISGANPNNRQAFLQDIGPDVTALTQGYKTSMESLGSTAIKT